MAKITSIVDITGTIGDLVFYQVNGKTYVRTKAKGLSERIKKDACYSGVRKRNRELQLANSLGTAIYRMAKAYATCMNYKVHNELVSRISQVVSSNPEDMDWQLFRSVLKGLHLNYNDTLPIVNIYLDEGCVMISHDKQHKQKVSIDLCIGTLPEIKTENGVRKAAIDMEDVALLSFSVLPNASIGNEFTSIEVQPNQVLVALVRYATAKRNYEWVRVI